MTNWIYEILFILIRQHVTKSLSGEIYLFKIGKHTHTHTHLSQQTYKEPIFFCNKTKQKNHKLQPSLISHGNEKL